MTTAIITDPLYRAHNDPLHVERADRLKAVERALDQSGLRERLVTLSPRAAEDDELAVVHDESYLQSIRRFGEHNGGYLDPDTYMNSDSWQAAVFAAGGVIRSVEAVLSGECHNAFALVRPPGHHATRNRAMGFCLINNVAVAARYALNQGGLQRVAIMDYDVHHGNGTQDIFYEEPNILYSSTHASPFYPGTGMLHETGAGNGSGATLNLPLPAGVGDQGYEQVFAETIIPALRNWKPELLFISAGYDAHWSDPIGPMVLSVTGYGRLTQMLADLASDVCDGRLVMVLEGGYNLEALGACVVAATRVLLNEEPDKDPLGTITASEPDVSNIVATVRHHHPLLTGASTNL